MDLSFLQVSHDHPGIVETTKEFLTEIAVQMGNAITETRVSSTGIFVLMLEGERYVGSASLHEIQNMKALEVKRVWIRKEYRGKGLANKLINELERIALENGFNRLVLDTSKSMTAAIALYKKNGFLEIPPYNDNPFAGLWFCKELSII